MTTAASVLAGVRSGQKYLTDDGVSAIRNGQARRRLDVLPLAPAAKPLVPSPTGAAFTRVDELLRGAGLTTVCREARCPNIGECWNRGTATFMLLGEVCTRACRFCAVDTGQPRGRVDGEEPARVAAAVAALGLGHVVLTSVNRDDLIDGGAGHFAATLAAIRSVNPRTTVEVLTPDYDAADGTLDTVLDVGVDVFAHNLETVRRLTSEVRDRRAGYVRSLDVLRHAAAHPAATVVKTGLMLGLGETLDEVVEAMTDARAAGVTVLTIGQYLRPTRYHLPIARIVPAAEFAALHARALELGFADCVAGQMVRSSYRAEEALARARHDR